MGKIGKNVVIAPTAVVAEGAVLGDGVSVGEHTIIGENVVVGEGSQIGSFVTISGRTTLGKNNKIYNYAALGTHPQDLKYAGEDTALILGDANIVREFTTLNLGTAGGHGETRIGNGNLFMAYTHVAHDCVVGNECILANVATLGGHVELGDFVNLGGLSAVHQFCRIGTGAMLAGGGMLTQDLPPFCIADGNRAFVRSLNKHRMRKMFSAAEIDRIEALFRAIFNRTEPIKDILTRELESLGGVDCGVDSVIKNICEFMLSTQRGLALKK